MRPILLACLFNCGAIFASVPGVAAAQITHYEADANLEPTHPLACVEIDTVTVESTAADVVAGVRDCAAQQRYDAAAELVAVASALAYYDTRRVADRTAHGALNALFAQAFIDLPDAEQQRLFTAMEALDQDRGRKDGLCNRLRRFEPPTYMPTYMIAHGMGAFSEQPGEPLVPDFDAESAWADALAFIQCTPNESPDLP